MSPIAQAWSSTTIKGRSGVLLRCSVVDSVIIHVVIIVIIINMNKFNNNALFFEIIFGIFIF